MKILGANIKGLLLLSAIMTVSETVNAEHKNVDGVADVLTWVVLVIIPITSLYVFWMLHVIPEKIAEKKNHPQKDAIHIMCILSLFVGGMLWPIALIWSMMKPISLQLEEAKENVDISITPAASPPTPPSPASPEESKDEAGDS